MKKTTILLVVLACLCVGGFFFVYWKPWREAKYRWTFRGIPTKPGREDLMRALRGEDVELSFEERLHYWRELERARDSHRTGTGTESFDQRYAHGALADRVQRYLDMDDILRQKYEIDITKEMLEKELARMERASFDRLRLEHYRKVLDDDRRLLREILAKPYLVERKIHERFILDPSIQEKRRLQAKTLRRGLDAKNFRERGGKYYARLRFWLGKGRPPAQGKRVAETLVRALTPANFRERAGRYHARLVFWLGEGRPPERGMLVPSRRMRGILTDVLKEPGEMTDLIEQETSFQILLLASREGDAATVDAITVPKAAEPMLIPGPRMRRVLSLLQKPEEMTGVINQENSFQILTLVSREEDAATVDAITVPKIAFGEWFARERALLKIQRELKGAGPRP